MIRVENLTKTYSIGEALKEVSFEIEQGEICGLIGPNGAGKTTLLRILATILRPTRGDVEIAGCRLPHEALAARKLIGYMPDSFATYEGLRVDSFLEFFAHIYALPRKNISKTIADVLTLVDLMPLRHARIATLSLGVRQRLSFARTLLHNPGVLLLDEPVSGLDPRARYEMRALLAELGTMGKCVLISSHVLADLSDICDRFIVVEQGRVAFSGTLEEIENAVKGPRRLEISVSGSTAEVRDFLNRQSFTQETHVDGDDNLELVLADESTPIDRIASLLIEHGFKVCHFAEQRVDLEEAFLRLTKGIVS